MVRENSEVVIIFPVSILQLLQALGSCEAVLINTFGHTTADIHLFVGGVAPWVVPQFLRVQLVNITSISLWFMVDISTFN